MEDGPQDRFAYAQEADGRCPTFVFNHLKEIVCDIISDLNILETQNPLRKDKWIDPHRLANACLLFSIAKDLKIKPGLFEGGDEKIIQTIQALLPVPPFNRERATSQIVEDWKYVVRHPVAKPFAIRERPFMFADYEEGTSLGYFGSFEMFVRFYLISIIRALHHLEKVESNSEWILSCANLIASNLRGRMYLDNAYHAMDACEFLKEGISFEFEEVELLLEPVWQKLKAHKETLQGDWWGENRSYILFDLADFMSGSEADEEEEENWRDSEESQRAVRKIFFQMVKHRGYPNDLLCQEKEVIQHYLSGVNQILLDPNHAQYCKQISHKETKALEPHLLVAASQALLYLYAYEHDIFCSHIKPSVLPAYLLYCNDKDSMLDEAACERLRNYELFAIADSEHPINSHIAFECLKRRYDLKRLSELMAQMSFSNALHRERGEEPADDLRLPFARPLLFGSVAQASVRRAFGPLPVFTPRFDDIQRALRNQGGFHHLTPHIFEIDLIDGERILQEEEARRNRDICVIC